LIPYELLPVPRYCITVSFSGNGPKASVPQKFVDISNSSTTGFSTERLKRIDQWVQQFIDSGNVPNAVLFIARKGNIVYHKAFGYSNIEKRSRLKTQTFFALLLKQKLSLP
jgi:CubicO group peptidase (beta-lactamase class C family)